MKPEVADRIERYRPRRDRAEQWNELRPLVLELARLSNPPSAKNASATMSALTAYVLWADEKGIPLKVENLAHYDVIDWFFAEKAFVESTEMTYRSALDRMVKTPRNGTKGRRRPVLPPYSEKDQAKLLRLPAHQPTRASALRVEAMLRAGLGVGARAIELRHLRPGDIQRAGDIVAVRLSDGTSERTVPALSAHAERLAELADEAQRLNLAYLVSGNGSPHQKNVISKLVSHINGSADAPRIVVSRLRTTWLVTQLQARTPIDVLLRVAGPITSARLEELTGYIDPYDLKEGRRLLAEADEKKRSDDR